eukprot:TRINITY_DN2332_c0_g1_i1.p1 TRINITY_DN2332_c0_g1~~TRINITY_DN2332_c0_g1_i1.p1  ORF type:complete len:449 (-),score=115.76 TRINITY_DN2332_c0_g1_i1:119-1465(-)
MKRGAGAMGGSQFDIGAPPSKMGAFGDFGGGMGCLGGLHAMGSMGCGGNVGFAAKMLVSAKEAVMISSGHQEIESTTGSQVKISGANELYPGTELQEVTVKAATSEIVHGAVQSVMAKMIDEQGRIMNTSRDMQEGMCSVRFVVPNAAAKSIIGRGGMNISAVRDQLGLKIHVEETYIGQAPLQEQIVSVFGMINAAPAAISNIFEKVQTDCANQDWWGTWIMTSNAGTDGGLPYGVALLGKGSKGAKGKGKGKDEMGKGKGSSFDMMGGGGGGGFGGMGGNNYGGMGQSPAAAAFPQNTAVLDQGTMEMIASGLDALPPSLATSREWTQQIEFTIPEACASTLIGKGGYSVREISQSTKTKVQVNKIDGNPAENVVVILGTAVGVVSAYLRCLSKIWELGPPQTHGGKGGMPGMGGAGVPNFNGGDISAMFGQFTDPSIAAAAAMLA